MTMMRIQSGQLVPLGYGKYVRSDDVVAVEPITDGRGPRRRALVWVRGLADPIIASRSEVSIVDDLVTPAEEAARMRGLRDALTSVVADLDRIPPLLARLLEQETAIDIDERVAQARQALG
jgi:hypothetical protein